MICKIEQNEDTTYPKISAKRDFPPVFVLILKYVVCQFWPFLRFGSFFWKACFSHKLSEHLILKQDSKVSLVGFFCIPSDLEKIIHPGIKFLFFKKKQSTQF